MNDLRTIRLAILLLPAFAVYYLWPTIVYWLKVAAVIGLVLLVIGIVGSLFRKEPVDPDAPGKKASAAPEGNAIIIAAIALLSVVAVLLLVVLVLM